MPSIDMPLDELRKYRGSSPCPKDIDSYWDNALKELEAIDPDMALTPTSLKIRNFDLFDMYFTGLDSARIHAKVLLPKAINGIIPAVLNFHGYGGSAGEFASHLWLASQDYAVFALDVRGQGGSSADVGGLPGSTLGGHFIRGLIGYDPDKLLMKRVFLDTARLAGLVLDMDFIDKKKVYAHGYSQGGGLSWACAALEPRVSKLAPVYPFFSDYKRVWSLDGSPGQFEEFKAFFRQFDPTHEREGEMFSTLAYVDVQNLAGRIRGETFLAVGLMDNVVPPSIQFAVYNKLTGKKRLAIYPEFAHEGLPGINDKILEFFAEDAQP